MPVLVMRAQILSFPMIYEGGEAVSDDGSSSLPEASSKPVENESSEQTTKESRGWGCWAAKLKPQP